MSPRSKSKKINETHLEDPVAIVSVVKAPEKRPNGQQVKINKPVRGVPAGAFSTIEGYDTKSGKYKITYRQKYYWVEPDCIETR
jgi:hypothetical protein